MPDRDELRDQLLRVAENVNQLSDAAVARIAAALPHEGSEEEDAVAEEMAEEGHRRGRAQRELLERNKGLAGS